MVTKSVTPRGRPRGLTLVLTSACNLRCSYCYQDVRGSRRMRWATVDRAMELLFRARRRDSSIVFYGGEPLLAFELVRRTVEEASRRRPRGRRLAFHLSTNGLLLDPAKARFLANHGVETQLSFDGSRQAQDLRAPRTFGRIARGLAGLRRECADYYRHLLEVAVTVTPAAVPTLAESVHWLVKRGIGKITLNAAAARDRDWTAEHERELDRQLNRVYRRSLRLFERTGRVPVTLFRRGPGRPVPTGESELCTVGECRSLTVDVDGQVYGCPVLARSYQTFPTVGLRRWVAPLRIGPVDAPDLEARLRSFRAVVHRSPLFGQRERKHSGGRRCSECPSEGGCSVCPLDIARGSDDPHRVPDFICAFNRVSLSYRQQFPPQLTVAPPG